MYRTDLKTIRIYSDKKEVNDMGRSKQQGFNGKQYKAIGMLAQSEMNIEEICEELDINPTTLWRWRQQPEFQKAVNDMAYYSLKGELPKVYGSLAKKAVGGNVKAIELMLKFADNFVERVETNVSGSMDLGGVNDDELERAIKEQERILGLAKGEE